jgi:DNA-directed RNA polymerase subunit RPC12/RpoP
MLRFAALMYVLSRLMLVISLVLLPVLFFLERQTSLLCLLLPAMLVPLALIWGLSASKVRCPVCGMQVLFNFRCEKHPKAARWGPLGPQATLAVRGLYARLLRCPYCGTWNKLAES